MAAQPRILISGASGLVGTALQRSLANRAEVVTLVRRPPRNASEVEWRPSENVLDLGSAGSFDGVINLSGENIAGGRWSAKRKHAIEASRVQSTDLLARTIASLNPKPRFLINASAIGYYGNRGDEVVDESSEPGSGFLPDTCRKWEAATTPAAEAGIRVALVRIGVVLARDGGMLKTLLPPFKLGLGGPVGSGRQFISWIWLRDLVRVIEFCMDHDVHGPINAVAGAATNRDFGRTLASVLHRPFLFPLPGFVVKAVFGEMGRALILSSTHVKSRVLQEAGFQFEKPSLDAVLKAELT